MVEPLLISNAIHMYLFIFLYVHLAITISTDADCVFPINSIHEYLPSQKQGIAPEKNKGHVIFQPFVRAMLVFRECNTWMSWQASKRLVSRL